MDVGERRVFAPWAAGSLGLGALSVESPLLAAAAGASLGLVVLPWMVLFGVLAVAATVQGFSYKVAGLTFRPDMLVTTVFALRAFTLAKRARLERVEWTLVVFVALQVVTSLLNARDPGESLRSAALLGFGALAYLSTYTVMSARKRLVTGARLLLGVAAVGAVSGILLLVTHYALGTSFGVTRLETLAGFPAANGLSYEHGLFGSTCAAGAVAFFMLWGERNPLFTEGVSVLGFWVCAAGTAISLSRGAWVGMVVALAVLAFAYGRVAQVAGRLLLTAVLAAALAGALLVAYPSSAGVGAETASALSTQAGRSVSLTSTATGLYRLEKWETSLEEIGSSPLLGLGTNSYGQRHFDLTIYGPKPAYVGNWFVRTLYDSGVIGLFLLLAFATPIVWPGRGVRRASGELAPVARALTGACVVLAVAYLATDSLLLVWPWILLGLTRAARVLTRAESD